MQERLEFIFQGTPDEFGFFKSKVEEKIPGSGITLDNYTYDGFHYSIINNKKYAFILGMIHGACYHKFGRLDYLDYLEGVKFSVFGHDESGNDKIVEVYAVHSSGALNKAKKLFPKCRFV